jgi:hypothetical protein
VTVDVQGDPDDASFVQVMQGRSSDPKRARQLIDQDSDKWAEFRPQLRHVYNIFQERYPALRSTRRKPYVSARLMRPVRSITFCSSRRCA